MGQVIGDDHVAEVDYFFAAGPASPSAPPAPTAPRRHCRPAVCCRLACARAAPRPPPRGVAQRLARRVGSAAGPPPTRRGSSRRRPRGGLERGRHATRAIIIIMLLLFLLFCFVCSVLVVVCCCRLLCCVWVCFCLCLCCLRVPVSLLFSSVVSCSCFSVCVAAVAFFCSCAGGGCVREVPRRSAAAPCPSDMAFDAIDGDFICFDIIRLTIFTLPRNLPRALPRQLGDFLRQFGRFAAPCRVGTDFVAFRR